MAYGHWVNVSTSYTSRPPQGHQDLTNRLHYWDAVYVNDTVIVQGYNHDWQTWDEPPVPPTPTRESHFPWFIYYNRRKADLK